MTTPTFQELLTSQDARDRAELFHHNPEKCSHWMTKYGHLYQAGENPACAEAVWQGYLQEAAPPPAPRVFKDVRHINYFDGSGFYPTLYYDRKAADHAATYHNGGKRLACVRVEITAIEGQYDY